MSDANGNGNGRIFNRLLSQIPIGIWITVIVQIVGFTIWLVRLDTRVSENSEKLAAMQAQLVAMDAQDTRAGALVRQKAEHIERAVAWLIANVTGTPGPGPRYYYDPNDPTKGPPPPDALKIPPDGPKLQSDDSRPYELKPVPPRE